MKITPFTIAIPDDAIADLKRRISATRWTDELRDVGWDYGTPNGYLRELLDYWVAEFDWRAQERALNSVANMTADVDGRTVHFIYERGTGPAPIPLLLSHGWPGSFHEFSKVVPLLTDPAAHGGDASDAFDVVIPSLPGFVFSDAFRRPGENFRRMSDDFHLLMTEGLGYSRYAAHGGDIGGTVTVALADRYPESLLSIHVTSSALVEPVFAEDDPELSAAEREFIAARARWREDEGAYAHQQSTKPQTLSHGLTDSPAGLAAWLVEKYRSWSDCGGDVESRFSKDELLTIISLYWFTNSIGSANRIYHENSRDRLLIPADQPIPVRTGLSVFEGDINKTPREWAERLWNLEHYSRIPQGGHFSAFEEPGLLATQLREFLRPLR